MKRIDKLLATSLGKMEISTGKTGRRYHSPTKKGMVKAELRLLLISGSSPYSNPKDQKVHSWRHSAHSMDAAVTFHSVTRLLSRHLYPVRNSAPLEFLTGFTALLSCQVSLTRIEGSRA